MTQSEFLDTIGRLFAERGQSLYGGERVTQLQHAIQAAELARKAGAPADEIAAALLHDIGHLLHNHGEDCAEDGVDDVHEELGVRLLTKHLPPVVTEPIRLHVQAKRYLTAHDPKYFGTLSPASITSLNLQGGPMNAEEMKTFESNPYYRKSVALRYRDEGAKDANAITPDLEEYLPYVRECLVS